ncbi:MAG: GatB/YqeY domain-containing protein [Ignavibacteria bacterium]|nr:GatB/YqeY domain-containing protein [Ignavibacteria bacterium]
MGLKEKINEEMKLAMKGGDKIRLETIRSIRAMIIEFEKSGANRDITPEDEVKMLNSAVKKRKEAIEQFTAGGRLELAEKEQAELVVLMEFLPKQLDEKEIEDIVRKLAADLQAVSKEQFSVLMPAVMKELKGKADGKIVRSTVEKVLGMN